METQRQAFVPAKIVSRNSVDLRNKSIKTLLVKFMFNKKEDIPPGIPDKKREADVSLDQKNAAKANNGLGQVGRVREGRVDTGIPIIRNLDFVQVRILRTGLSNHGIFLVSAHWFYHVGKDKYVVVLEYAMYKSPQYTVQVKWDAATTEGIRALSRVVWQYCHIWENPPAATGEDYGIITVNLIGKQQPQQRSKNMLAVRDAHIVGIPFVESED